MSKKKKKWLYIGAAIVILFGAYFWLKPKKTVTYTTMVAAKGPLTQTVSETGTITPLHEIDLNFQNNGTLAKLDVKVGDKVKAGQVLAELNYSALSIQAEQAGAQVAVSQAGAGQAQSNYDTAVKNLAKLKSTTQQNIDQLTGNLNDLNSKDSAAQTTQAQNIVQAQTALDNAKQTGQQAIDNAAGALATDLNNKFPVGTTALDAINKLLNDADAKNVLGALSVTSLNQATGDYGAAGNALSKTLPAVSAAQGAGDNTLVVVAYNQLLDALNKTLVALNSNYALLQNSIVSNTFSQTLLDNYKTSINAQINNVTVAVAELQSRKQTYDSAVLAYSTNLNAAQQTLTQAKLGLSTNIKGTRDALTAAKLSRDQQINTAQGQVDAAAKALAIAKAQVLAAQAGLDAVKNQIGNSLLTAPLDGIIAKSNYEIGEQVMALNATKPIFTVDTTNAYEIDIDVAETDVNKIKLGQTADITFDAFGNNKIFKGAVYFIEPASTIIAGVTYYQVKVSLTDATFATASSSTGATATDLIKPGMTANVVITTAQKDNILAVPLRALIDKSGSKFLAILINGQSVETPVSVGVSGDNGMVEIVSGLNVGDNVITFTSN